MNTEDVIKLIDVKLEEKLSLEKSSKDIGTIRRKLIQLYPNGVMLEGTKISLANDHWLLKDNAISFVTNDAQLSTVISMEDFLKSVELTITRQR